MGGGSKAAPAPDPMKEAQARDWEAQQQSARDASAAAAAKMEQDARDARALSEWNARADNMLGSTQQYARGKLEGYGLGSGDQYGLFDKIMTQLSGNRSGLVNNQDFSTQLGTNVVDNLIADTRSSQRNSYTRQINNLLGNNYLSDTFADTVDDQYLDAILNEQYSGAQTDLQNALNRGQMNQTAYDRALASLSGTKSGARSKLETLGKGVISDISGGTKTAYDNLFGQANNFDFGDNIDITGGVDRIKAGAGTALGGLEGRIRDAVGDTKYFDTTSAIAKANAAGGASTYTPNTGSTGGGTNALYQLFNDQARNKRTEGAF